LIHYRQLTLSRSVPDRRENTGKDDTEAPYPIGEHGLYVLQNPVAKEPRSNLPRADSNVQCGVSKTVVLEDDRFLQPGEPVTLLQMLEEGPPEEAKPPSIVKMNFRRALKFIVDPKADSKYWYLPKGLNRKIKQDKDPLKDKVRRLGKPSKLKKKHKVGVNPARDNVPLQNEEHAVKLPRPQPAPTRFVPPIDPAVAFERGHANDEFGNPFGGEHSAFSETAEQRNERIAARLRETRRRELSDKILAERKTPQFRSK